VGQVGEELKREYEGRLKQLEVQKERKSLTKENDQTVVIQRQHQEQLKTIRELRDSLQEALEAVEALRK
jgi:lysozyme family protein